MCGITALFSEKKLQFTFLTSSPPSDKASPKRSPRKRNQKRSAGSDEWRLTNVTSTKISSTRGGRGGDGLRAPPWAHSALCWGTLTSAKHSDGWLSLKTVEHTHTLQPLLFNDYFFWRCHREMWGGSSSNRHVGRLFSLKVDGFSSKIRFFLSLGSTTADIIIVRQYWLCCLPRTLTQGWNDQDHFCLIRLFFQVTGSVETLVSCSPALMCGGATVTDAVLLFLTFLYIFSVRWFCLHIIFGFVGIL